MLLTELTLTLLECAILLPPQDPVDQMKVELPRNITTTVSTTDPDTGITTTESVTKVVWFESISADGRSLTVDFSGLVTSAVLGGSSAFVVSFACRHALPCMGNAMPGSNFVLPAVCALPRA
jgi:hypothetical protein